MTFVFNEKPFCIGISSKIMTQTKFETNDESLSLISTGNNVISKNLSSIIVNYC